MEIVQSVILGIIQGLTEFLPVSSSAHLVVAPAFMGASHVFLHSLAFDVALHGGTLVAVTIYYRRELLRLITGTFDAAVKRRTNPDFVLAVKLAAATIPAVIAGIFFGDWAESVFRGPYIIAGLLLVFGVCLWLADIKGAKAGDMAGITFKYALIIGLFQALAIMPGVSRSGITITAALMLGIKRQDSAQFSFLLSFPVILGAFVFKLNDLSGLQAGESAMVWAGFAAAAVSGFFAIRFLLSFVRKSTYMPFAVYRALLAAVIVVFTFAGNK